MVEGERVNAISSSCDVLIAVATRIYGFVLPGYASTPWQSILYGTFCVSRICHSRRVARFGHRKRCVSSRCSKRNRNERDPCLKRIVEIWKNRKFGKNWNLTDSTIFNFSSRSRDAKYFDTCFARLGFLETKLFKNRISSNSVIDFRSLASLGKCGRCFIKYQ